MTCYPTGKASCSACVKPIICKEAIYSPRAVSEASEKHWHFPMGYDGLHGPLGRDIHTMFRLYSDHDLYSYSWGLVSPAHMDL